MLKLNIICISSWSFSSALYLNLYLLQNLALNNIDPLRRPKDRISALPETTVRLIKHFSTITLKFIDKPYTGTRELAITCLLQIFPTLQGRNHAALPLFLRQLLSSVILYWAHWRHTNRPCWHLEIVKALSWDQYDYHDRCELQHHRATTTSGHHRVQSSSEGTQHDQHRQL